MQPKRESSAFKTNIGAILYYFQTELLDTNNDNKVEEEEEEELVSNAPAPDSNQLVRRGALLPPKMDDPMDPVIDPGGPNAIPPPTGSPSTSGNISGMGGNSDVDNEYANMEAKDNFDPSLSGCGGNALGVLNRGLNGGYPPRRSSVVVIPPMQVCPGDLLVYSKVLTHRGNLGKISHCKLFSQALN